MAKKAVSVQKTTDIEPRMGGLTLPMTFFSSADVAPEWGLSDRDAFLRTFWKRFGADMLQGVIATVVAKVQTQNWELEGPRTLTTRSHRMLRDESDFYRGYDSLISRGLQDYYTQDNGWFQERLRSGPRDLSGPCLGLSHLDSARMHPTGNVEYPYAYEDVDGVYHLMHRSQYIRIVDLPTPATELYSDERGFCALSRTLSTAIILTMLAAMKREKLADLPPSALAIFNNISRKQFEQSIRLGAVHDDAKDNMIWRQLLPLFGIDPAHEAKVQFISLREVWESYDDQTAMDIAAYSFAAGFRIDPREFWPVSQGPLGTGKEAEVQHQKAKAKAHGLIFTQLERHWNSEDTLPAQVRFKFVIQDIDEEEQRAKIHASQIGNIEAMQKAGAGLTSQEVRYLLCKQYKVLPRALLNVPEEGQEQDLTMADVYMDDVERQAKEFGGWYFGPRVKMLADGTLIEPDYRSGLLPGRKELVLEAPVYVGDLYSTIVGGEDVQLILGEKGKDYEEVEEEIGNEVVVEPSTKELTLQTLTKDFSCCPSHAAQEFPGLIDNLKELGYISTEESYAADLLPPDNVFAIATALKEVKQGDDLLMAFTRGLRRQLGLREFSVGEKQHRGLETINEKISKLPKSTANQIRRASNDLMNVMSNKDRQQAILDIPDEVWEEAERLDLLDLQPETGTKGGSGSGNYGHAGRPGMVGGSGGSGAQYVYRGEFAKLHDKVTKSGLRGKVWNNRPKSVYMTTSEREAHLYGLSKANDAGVSEYTIVKIRIPDGTSIIADERDTKPVYGRFGAIRVEGNIPSSWIESVTHYDIPESVGGMRLTEIVDTLYPDVKELAYTIAYVAIILDNQPEGVS